MDTDTRNVATLLTEAQKRFICRDFPKPSNGLEPLTPSLPSEVVSD